MESVTSPHSRYHYSNGLEQEKSKQDNQASKKTIEKQVITTEEIVAKETSKKESKS